MLILSLCGWITVNKYKLKSARVEKCDVGEVLVFDLPMHIHKPHSHERCVTIGWVDFIDTKRHREAAQ
jgi:hypothetical protein